MRMTDKKGALIGVVLAVIVIATMLLLIAFIDIGTAEALSIVNVNNFSLKYGRIENVFAVNEDYNVILTYYDNAENVTGNRIKTVKVTWDSRLSKLYVNDTQEDLATSSLKSKYLIKVYQENIRNIELFSKAIAVNSRNEELIEDGVGYYRTWTQFIADRYIAEDIRGNYIFIGNDIKVGNSISIYNGRVENPNRDLYSTILCTNANQVTLPPLTTGGNNITLGEILATPFDMYWLSSNYQNGYAQGYAEGANYADSQVNMNSASYIAGYNAGQQGEYTFLNLLTAVVDAPVKAVAGIFNIEILGYNMLYFVTGLLTIGLIFFIVRKLGGGL